MFKNQLNTVLLVFLTALGSFSCSQYEKIVKSDDVNLKYSKAFEYYNKGDYTKGGCVI